MPDQVEWQHGLCGCLANCDVCIITYFLPCYTAGKIAHKVGDSCILHGLFFFVPCLNCICITKERRKVRHLKGIYGSTLDDCLAAWCCVVCALVQEAQEVDALFETPIFTTREEVRPLQEVKPLQDVKPFKEVKPMKIGRK